MKSFRDFMEDGAGAMGSGAAGLGSSGGSSAIPSTNTKGVAGAGSDSSTVPVSKKTQQKIVRSAQPSLRHRQSSVNMVRPPMEEAIESPRRPITRVGFKDFVKSGGQTVPPESFMTKEEYMGEMANANMDKRALVAHITKLGWTKRASGGSGDHEIYTHPRASHRLAVPRHSKPKATIINSIIKASKKFDREPVVAEDTKAAQKEITKSNADTVNNPTGFATQSPEPEVTNIENDLVKFPKKRK